MMGPSVVPLPEVSTGRKAVGAWWVPVVVAACLALAITRPWEGRGLGDPGTHDLIAYWGAGQLLRDGGSPYDFNALLAVQRAQGWAGADPVPMWNPPLLLVWIYPLLLLPFPVAASAWYALGVVLVAGCAAMIWRDLGGPRDGWAPDLACAAALVFAPVRITLHMGQMSFLLLVGVAGFLHFATRGRDVLGGACLALTAIKPHVVYLVWIAAFWWTVRERRWGVAVGVAALLAPTIGLLGLLWPDALTGYRTILESPPLHFLTPTLGGILRGLIGPGARGLGPVIAAVVGVGLLATLLIRRPALDWRSALGPLLLLSVATAPYGWCFDQTVLLVPYLAILGWAARPTIEPVKRVGIVAGLVLINAVLMAQNNRVVAEVYLFWTPWALGALSLYARPIGRPRPAVA